MTWTDLPPFTVGHVVTAAEMNELVANLDILHHQHGARAHLTSNFTSVFAGLSMTTEDYDSDAYHSTSVNPSRFTIPSGYDGVYLLTGQATYLAASNAFQQSIYLNGTVDLVDQSGVTVANQAILSNTIASLTVGDYVELYPFSGGNTIVAGVTKTFFQLTWLGKL